MDLCHLCIICWILSNEKTHRLFLFICAFFWVVRFLNVVRFSRLCTISIILIVVSFIISINYVSVLGPKTAWILGLKNVNFQDKSRILRDLDNMSFT